MLFIFISIYKRLMSLEAMVRHLRDTGYITSKKVEEAMLAVDRAFFVPHSSFAYDDRPFPIGSGQTISAPSVVAFMLEHLQLEKGMKVLELGTGSGYNTALTSHIIGSKGKVISFERVAELIKVAKKNLAKMDPPKNIFLHVGDASCGYPEEAPYDRIIVTGGIPHLDDNPMVSQLKPGGKIVAPVGDRFFQNIVVYDKDTKSYKSVLPVMFVPILGKCGFKGD